MTDLITLLETPLGKFARLNRPVEVTDLNLISVVGYHPNAAPAYATFTFSVDGLSAILPKRSWADVRDPNTIHRSITAEQIIKSGPNIAIRLDKAIRDFFGHYTINVPLLDSGLTQRTMLALIEKAQSWATQRVADFNQESIQKLNNALGQAASSFEETAFSDERRQVRAMQTEVHHWKQKLIAAKDELHKLALAEFAKAAEASGITDIVSTESILATKRNSPVFGD